MGNYASWQRAPLPRLEHHETASRLQVITLIPAHVKHGELLEGVIKLDKAV